MNFHYQINVWKLKIMIFLYRCIFHVISIANIIFVLSSGWTLRYIIGL